MLWIILAILGVVCGVSIVLYTFNPYGRFPGLHIEDDKGDGLK